MNVEALNLTNMTQLQGNRPADKLEESRKEKDKVSQADQQEQEKVQPEELLSQIKALTEDGIYSVRFENDNDAGELIVKVVDRETDEVIRQIPPEELLSLTKRLNDLRGNIVDTQS